MNRQLFWKVDNSDQANTASKLCKIIQILGVVYDDHNKHILPLLLPKTKRIGKVNGKVNGKVRL